MNRSVVLHIVERLEGLLSRLPAAIQKPVRQELTPLKELFLQQRAPRFMLAGSDRLPLPEIVNVLFSGEPANDPQHTLFEVFRWQTLEVKNRGTISVLDARGSDEQASYTVREELRRQPADVIFIISDGSESRTNVNRNADNGRECVAWNDELHRDAGIIAIHLRPPISHNGQEDAHWSQRIQSQLHGRVWGGFEFWDAREKAAIDRAVAEELAARLTAKLPNECREEMARISRNREAQREVANRLIKSASAICAAIGAQPIPLADLPILTALQLAMVSGIMYISGRERSLRAATEFIGALGVNVGAGMLLRESVRAMLKFFPGWGNVVCGMVAGAGTYAIGHAASAYFLEGVTLQEARRAYLQKRKRKKADQLQLP